jgi:hypothetical protein
MLVAGAGPGASDPANVEIVPGVEAPATPVFANSRTEQVAEVNKTHANRRAPYPRKGRSCLASRCSRVRTVPSPVPVRSGAKGRTARGESSTAGLYPSISPVKWIDLGCCHAPDGVRSAVAPEPEAGGRYSVTPGPSNVIGWAKQAFSSDHQVSLSRAGRRAEDDRADGDHEALHDGDSFRGTATPSLITGGDRMFHRSEYRSSRVADRLRQSDGSVRVRVGPYLGCQGRRRAGSGVPVGNRRQRRGNPLPTQSDLWTDLCLVCRRRHAHPATAEACDRRTWSRLGAVTYQSLPRLT